MAELPASKGPRDGTPHENARALGRPAADAREPVFRGRAEGAGRGVSLPLRAAAPSRRQCAVRHRLPSRRRARAAGAVGRSRQGDHAGPRAGRGRARRPAGARARTRRHRRGGQLPPAHGPLRLQRLLPQSDLPCACARSRHGARSGERGQGLLRGRLGSPDAGRGDRGRDGPVRRQPGGAAAAARPYAGLDRRPRRARQDRVPISWPATR